MNVYGMYTSNRLDLDYSPRPRKRDRASIAPVTDLLDARHGAPRQKREQGLGIERRTIVQAQGESTIACARRLCMTAQRRWRAAERLLHTVVELANAGEARCKRDLG